MSFKLTVVQTEIFPLNREFEEKKHRRKNHMPFWHFTLRTSRETQSHAHMHKESKWIQCI